MLPVGVSSKQSSGRLLALLVLVLALVACCATTPSGAEQSSSVFKEATGEEAQPPQQQVAPQRQESSLSGGGGVNAIRANSRLLAVPHSLARFLFYNSRGPSERQAQSAFAMGGGGGGDSGPAPSYKRSSSQLDALNGVTLGKRSAPSEFVNYEPIFGRQSFVRGPARVYDMRWAPFDSFDAPSASSDY